MKHFAKLVLFFLFGVIHEKVYSETTRFGTRIGGNWKAPIAPVDPRAISTKWLAQKLDHFDANVTDEWQQRYFVNDQFFNATAKNVAYLFVGSTSEVNSAWTSYGSWIETAPTTGALLFVLEHRYYGESQPKEDLSTENLKYLSSKQAVADAAFFIEEMNKQYELAPDVKWIAFGGSFAGSLAAWLREKYPDHVHGAVASSAPILAEVDFQDYLGVVANNLKLQSQECVDAVQESFVQLEDVVNKKSTLDINKVLNLCDPIEENLNIEENISELFLKVANIFSSVSISEGFSEMNLNYTCSVMTDEALGTPLERLGKFWEKWAGYCLTYDYQEIMNVYEDVDPKYGDGKRQWLYQTCTEFGYFQTSSKKPQIFGDRFSTEFYVKMCTDAFGPKFDMEFISNAVKDTNEYYGGLNINVTNVLFTFGSVDPWQPLGLLESNDPKVPVIYINGRSTVADMYPSDPSSDSEELLAAKAAISKYVLTWLNE